MARNKSYAVKVWDGEIDGIVVGLTDPKGDGIAGITERDWAEAKNSPEKEYVNVGFYNTTRVYIRHQNGRVIEVEIRGVRKEKLRAELQRQIELHFK